ncbi:MAG TPA: AAA family ATPase, partial [Ilumatobacteraceae bacterium]
MATPVASCPVLVERDRELGVLTRVASEVARGMSQLVIVSGEAGAGKSRLVTEFIGSLPRTWRTDVMGGARSNFPPLEAATSTAVGDRPELDIGAALAASLRLSPARPTVVLVEDVHELDPALIRALGVAVDLLEATPLLLVMTFRIDQGVLDPTASRAIADLRRQNRVLDLTVGPISGDGVAIMAEALGRNLDDDGVADVLRRSGGNAFFAEELLLAGDASLSWTVTHTVLERVRAVDAAGQRVAEILAVGGAALPRAVVEAVEPKGADGIVTLLGAGIAVESGDATVSLRHALVGEVIVAHLSLAERTALHGALAACLEQRND